MPTFKKGVMTNLVEPEFIRAHMSDCYPKAQDFMMANEGWIKKIIQSQSIGVSDTILKDRLLKKIFQMDCFRKNITVTASDKKKVNTAKFHQQPDDNTQVTDMDNQSQVDESQGSTFKPSQSSRQPVDFFPSQFIALLVVIDKSVIKNWKNECLNSLDKATAHNIIESFEQTLIDCKDKPFPIFLPVLGGRGGVHSSFKYDGVDYGKVGELAQRGCVLHKSGAELFQANNSREHKKHKLQSHYYRQSNHPLCKSRIERLDADELCEFEDLAKVTPYYQRDDLVSLFSFFPDKLYCPRLKVKRQLRKGEIKNFYNNAPTVFTCKSDNQDACVKQLFPFLMKDQEPIEMLSKLSKHWSNFCRSQFEKEEFFANLPWNDTTKAYDAKELIPVLNKMKQFYKKQAGRPSTSGVKRPADDEGPRSIKKGKGPVIEVE